MEAFPDEGDMDMPKALAAYRDVGYPYMLMPHHVPQILPLLVSPALLDAGPITGLRKIELAIH